MSDTEKDPEEGATEEESTETEASESESSAEKTDGATSPSDDSDDGDSDSEDSDSDDDGSVSASDDEEEEDEDDEEEGDEEEDEGGSSASLLIGVLALAAGFGIGWFGHEYQVNKKIKTADAAVQGEGEGARGPCKDWEAAICSEFTEQSFPCTQAKNASSLLSGSACEQALSSIKGQIDKIKATRAPCDNLMNKLCGELGAESKSCGLVKTQTPNFPPERCTEMEKNYDQILKQLQMMEKRGGPPGAGGPRGAPPGHPPMRGGPGPVRVQPGKAPPSGAAPGKPAGTVKPKPAEAKSSKPAAPAPKPAAPAPQPAPPAAPAK